MNFSKRSAKSIHELEVLLGQDFLALIVYYIDNGSARTLSKGTERHKFRFMHDRFVELEPAWQHKAWFGRCPSTSNPADGASRLDLSWFEGKHTEQTSLNWEQLRHHLNIKGERLDRR